LEAYRRKGGWVHRGDHQKKLVTQFCQKRGGKGDTKQIQGAENTRKKNCQTLRGSAEDITWDGEIGGWRKKTADAGDITIHPDGDVSVEGGD